MKSTLAVHLSSAWAQGQRTLLIDCDEQGDSSAWLGVDDTGEALADALAGQTSLDAAIPTSEFGVDVAPAGETLGYVAESVHPDGCAERSTRSGTAATV